MSIRRAPRPEAGFTIIANETLRDERLSYRARGVLAAILSRPDNWTVSADRLAHEAKEGRGAILTAMKELEAVGYIVRTRSQSEAGHWQTEVVVYDTPQVPKPKKASKPKAAKPAEPQRYADKHTATAARIVSKTWAPLAAGKIAQSEVAVIKAITTALSNGITVPQLEAALIEIATKCETVTVTRLTRAINGTPTLEADRKTDWSAYLADASTGEVPF